MFKVLIVDNSAVYSKMVQELIVSRYAFIDACVINSAPEAIKAVKQFLPDVVIVSIHIDGINGLKLVKIIKSINEDTRIIVFSNFSMEEYKKSSLDAGADYFFNKDADASEILNVIQEILPVEDEDSANNPLLINTSDVSSSVRNQAN